MDPKRLKKLLANPGERSKLPDSMLPPDLLAKRKLNRRLNAPVTAGSSQTNRDMAHARNAALEIQYGAPQRQLQAQQTRDAGFYDQYLQMLREAQARQQAQAAATAQQIQGLGQAGLAASAQQTSQVMSGLQAQAAPLGATVDPSIANTGVQASLIRQAMLNAQGATAASNALAEGDLLRTRESAGGLAKLEHQSDLSSQLQSLLRERGAAGAKFDEDYRENARRAVLENQAFGLDQAKFEADLANTEFDNWLAEEKYYADQQQRAKSNARADAKLKLEESKAKAKGGKYTWQPQQAQAKARSAVATTAELAKKLRAGQGIPDGEDGWIVEPGKKSRQEAARSILSDPKAPDNVLVSAALDIAYDGKLSRGTIKRLHEAGYKVGPMGYPTK